jgi:hypothetical protein
LAHELGHVIGREHSDDDHGLMASTLEAGERLSPDTDHQTTRPPVHQTLFRGQESGLWSAFADLGSPLHIPHSAFRTPHSSDSPLLSSIQHPASSLQHSAFRTPTSDLEIADSFFARLDDEAGERTDGVLDEDERDGEQSRGESEDGLDLWSVLYGLE